MPGSHHKAPPALAEAEPQVTLEGLPPANTTRWVARRKAQVVGAVQAGLLSLDDALARYRLSPEEFIGWQRALYRHGLRGLQITHSQLLKIADRKKRKRPNPERPKTERRGLSWRRRHA